MTALSTLARMLGLPVRLAEDAMHSERAAKAVLSRRSLFAASAAMVGGVAFGEVRGLGRGTLTLTAKSVVTWNDLQVYFNGVRIPALVTSYAVTVVKHSVPASRFEVEVF